jgi:ferredoxin-NADP reductase
MRGSIAARFDGKQGTMAVTASWPIFHTKLIGRDEVAERTMAFRFGKQQTNPNFKLIATMTDMASSHRPWTGETGLIDQQLLSRHLEGAASPIYYIAGPPGMVKRLHAMLDAAAVDDDDIRTEVFTGY